MDETAVCPATFSVGLEILGVPILKPAPPGVTFAVVWQPELPQSGGGLVGGM